MATSSTRSRVTSGRGTPAGDPQGESRRSPERTGERLGSRVIGSFVSGRVERSAFQRTREDRRSIDFRRNPLDIESGEQGLEPSTEPHRAISRRLERPAFQGLRNSALRQRILGRAERHVSDRRDGKGDRGRRVLDQRTPVDGAALAPTRGVALIRRIAGPIWQMVGYAAVLTVADRRTGSPRRIRLIPVKVDGTWHLLSFGGVTEWARDLRAAGVGELRRKGRTQAFTAVEVEGDERDRVIAAYLRGSGPIKNDFNRRPDPADHAVFRVEPIS
jgi:hypothetical protein